MTQITSTLFAQLQLRADQRQCSVEQLLQKWLDQDIRQEPDQPVVTARADTVLPPAAEAIVREGENRFRMISDMVGGYAFVMSVMPGRVARVEWVTGATLLKITGYNKDELDQDNWVKLGHPEDDQRIQENFSKLIATPCEIRDEYRFVSKAGATFYVSSVARSIADETGRVVRIFGVTNEISKQVLVRQGLEEAEAQNRLISEITTDYSFYFETGSAENPAIHWITSGRFEEMTGYAESEMDNLEAHFQFIHPDDRSLVMANITILSGVPNLVPANYRLIAKNGDLKYISTIARSVADPTGRVSRIYVGVRDITEQKQAEAALHESEERYRAVVDALTEGVMFGTERTVHTVNASAERILGLTAKQMTNSAIMDPRWWAIHEDGTLFARKDHPVTISLQTGQPQVNVIMGIHKPDDQLTWVSINTTPLVHPGETKPYAVVASLVDITTTKTSADMLAKSEQRYRHMFEHNSATQLLINPNNGKIVQASPGACQFYGYSPEQFQTLNIADLNTLPQSEIQAEMDLARYEKRNFFEFRHRLASGEICDVDVYSGPVEIDNETYLYSIVQDVTERKRIEQTLRENEARYRAVVNVLTEGVILQAVDGTIIASNTSAEHILGLSSDQIKGRTSTDPRWQAVHEDGSPFPGEGHPSMIALQTGEPQNNRVMGVHKPNGELTWISINAQPLVSPGESMPYAVATSFTDITERVQFETALNRHVQQLETLRKVATVLTENLDLQRTISVSLASSVEASKADRGYIALLEQNQLRIVQVQGVYPWRNDPQPVDLMGDLSRRVLQTGQPELAAPLTASDTGSQIGCPLVVQDRVIGIIMLETDHAELFTTDAFDFVQVLVGRIAVAIENARLYSLSQQQIIELKALYDKVSSLEQLKSDMIRIGSHDLRNPLGLVAGFTELLKMDLWESLTVDHQHMLDQIQKGTERMIHITSDILSLERIDSTSNQPMASLDLGDLVGMAFHELKEQSQAKDQEYLLDLEAADSPLIVSGDEAQLYEALTNLIGNAIKYTPNNGQIKLTLKTAEDQAVFTVKDTGHGIPLAMQARLFQPFFRAKTEDTRDIDGTGLGLHLVKNVIERCNGTIIFQSTQGEGSTFGFKLPLVASVS
jgi:hypothetical protein